MRLVCLWCCCFAVSLVSLDLDIQRTHVDLNGDWQCLADNTDAEMWKPQVQQASSGWEQIEIPTGNLLPDKFGDHQKAQQRHLQTKSVWVRRTFDIDPERVQQQAVLQWNAMRFGGAVWINGQFITRHALLGPHHALLPKGLLQKDDNEILIQVMGWDGIEKGAGGIPLIPIGGASQKWGGKSPGIAGDIWLEFYDRAYVSESYVESSLADQQLKTFLTLDAVDVFPNAMTVSVSIVDVQTGQTIRSLSKDIIPNGKLKAHETLCFDARDLQLWSPASPYLYRMQIELRCQTGVCDRASFQFGHREISMQNGRFQLNGKPLWLRGSNLVHEWSWGHIYNQNVKQYIIDEARSMNLNVFRTHTEPPPALWTDTADKHGMLFMAEMLLLYNHGDFKYTDAEYAVLHDNAIKDASAWIKRIRNHPSVIMWVISNESHLDNEWESTAYFDAIKQLDPSRPIMRTGESVYGTPDALDIHTCFNVVRGAEGDLWKNMQQFARRKDPARPFCNTEYMNHMWNPSGRYFGKENDPRMPLAYAKVNMEHTEAMRRLQVDCLLPYMYAGWTRLRGKMNWRDDFPTPMAASLHSSMAPVIASLEVFDCNYVAGTTVELPIHLINELEMAVDARLSIYITPEDPLCVPDTTALLAHVWKTTQQIQLNGHAHQRKYVTISLPEREGQYYLAAVLERAGDRPVVSQRDIRVLKPVPEKTLESKRVTLLGGRPETKQFFIRHGATVLESLGQHNLQSDLVVLDDIATINFIQQPGIMAFLQRYAQQGGRVLILPQQTWPQEWRAFVDMEIGLPRYGKRNPVRCSRAHLYDNAKHDALAGLQAAYLWRWNGLPGVIGNNVILEHSAVLKSAHKIAWISRPKYAALIAVPKGKGEALCLQLHVRERLNPDQAAFDPVVERLLLNCVQ